MLKNLKLNRSCLKHSNPSIRPANSLSSISYFDTPFRSSDSVAKLSSFDILGIEHFLNSFDETFRASKTKSTFVSGLAHLCLLFSVLYLSLNSSFVTYIASNHINVRLPVFVHILLTKISCPVRSENKIQAQTKGNVVCISTTEEVIAQLKTLCSEENTCNVFLNTPFSSICSDTHQRRQFKQHLSLKLQAFETALLLEFGSEDAIFELMLKVLSTTEQVPMKGSESLPVFTGTIPNGVSPYLGIYRFRNSADQDVYYTSQTSCVSLTPETMNLYAVFLKLFKPIFYQDSECLNTATTFLPGDAEFSVERRSQIDAWLKLFSYNTVSPTNPPGNALTSKGPKKRKPGFKKMEVVETSDVSTEDSGFFGHSRKDLIVCANPDGTAYLYFSNYRENNPLFYIKDLEDFDHDWYA
jgi:hypothetical protein